MDPTQLIEDLCRRHGVPRAFGEKLRPLLRRAQRDAFAAGKPHAERPVARGLFVGQSHAFGPDHGELLSRALMSAF